MLWFFHRHSWYAPDEGNYAHVAERLLQGEVLHLQVQDVHPGHINFLNAAAFRLFGVSLVSLRYPLLLASFWQALVTFLIFPAREAGTALVASLAITALGVVQFLNPTANWYCLSLIVTIIACLTWWQRPGRARLVVLGMLLGTLALFRQLTGALIALGVLGHLMFEAGGTAAGRQVLLQRSLLALGALALVLYLVAAADAGGWVLFGIWPLLLLAWWFKEAHTANREVARLLGWLTAGGVAASIPLLLYHLVHGSLGAWFHDVTGGAVGLTRLGFFRQSSVGLMAVAGLLQLFSGHLQETINGIYWLALPLVAAMTGIGTLRALQRREASGPLPVLAVFGALVTLYYQIPIYLAYTVGLSLVGLLSLSRPGGRARAVLVAGAALLLPVALHYHAGQPVSRGTLGNLTGQRVPLAPSEPLARVGLLIPPAEHDRYVELVALIQRETRPDEAIFALPSNAELYFLGRRRNPFRFFNTALGVRDDEELAAARRILTEDAPGLVIFNPNDKYGTQRSAQLMQTVRERYTLIRTIGHLEIYRRTR